MVGCLSLGILLSLFIKKEVGTRVGLGWFLGCHSGVMMPISTVGKGGIILHLPFSTDREVT